MSVAGRSGPLRVVVIGCGAAFENLYVEPLRRLQRQGAIKVVGLVDSDEKRRRWAAGVMRGAMISGNLAELLDRARPDLTLVISPPRLHAEQCLAAMERGSHVLCEKPLADAVSSGQRIVEGAARFGRLAGVEMPRRFYPNSAEARSRLAEGMLGSDLTYTYREGSIYSWPVVSESAFKREIVGGGVLQDKGPHVLDLLEWTFGPAELIGAEDDAWHGGVEANSVLRLVHGGVRGMVQLSWDQELNNGFLIRGSKGEMLVPLGPVDFYLIRKPGEAWTRVETKIVWPTRAERERPEPQMPRTAYAGIELQVLHAVRAILHGEPLPVPVEDGLRTLTLIEAAYRDARPLSQPWLSADEQQLQAERHWRSPQT
jgi:predicted dehydrogenase